MNLTIIAPSAADEIIATVEAIEEPKFKLAKKQGINLIFEVEGMDDKNAAGDIAKKALKHNPKLLGAAYSIATYL